MWVVLTPATLHFDDKVEIKNGPKQTPSQTAGHNAPREKLLLPLFIHRLCDDMLYADEAVVSQTAKSATYKIGICVNVCFAFIYL